MKQPNLKQLHTIMKEGCGLICLCSNCILDNQRGLCGKIGSQALAKEVLSEILDNPKSSVASILSKIDLRLEMLRGISFMEEHK